MSSIQSGIMIRIREITSMVSGAQTNLGDKVSEYIKEGINLILETKIGVDGEVLDFDVLTKMLGEYWFVLWICNHHLVNDYKFYDYISYKNKKEILGYTKMVQERLDKRDATAKSIREIESVLKDVDSLSKDIDKFATKLISFGKSIEMVSYNISEIFGFQRELEKKEKSLNEAQRKKACRYAR